MQTRDGNEAPMLEIPNTENAAPLAAARDLIAAKNTQLEQIRQDCESAFQTWLTAARQSAVEGGSSTQFNEVTTIRATFDEGKGKNTTAFPELKGKISGPANWVDTPLSKGLAFGGKTYVDFGNVGDFERDASFSLAAWVKPTGGQAAVIARMDDGKAYRG